MKPFLLVSTRPEEEALDSEYQAYLKGSGLEPDQLDLAEFDLVGLPPIDPEKYAGVFVAGSPYGTAGEDGYVSSTQAWVRSELEDLFRQLLEADTPILATGTAATILGTVVGAAVSGENAEYGEVVDIELDRLAKDDPIFGGLSRVFLAYVNHGEAIDELPEGTVRLARSLNTPVQAFRYDPYTYAVQFNPELDADAIAVQIEAFIDAGDLGLADSESLVGMGRHTQGTHSAAQILRAFAEHFSK